MSDFYTYQFLQERTLPNQDNEANSVLHLDSIAGFCKQRMMPCNLEKKKPNQKLNTFSTFLTTPKNLVPTASVTNF